MAKTKLIKGENLTPEQKKQVLSAFVYRWTVENMNRAKIAYKNLSSPSIEPIPDSQWLAEHAFYFRKDGRLANSPRHCVPVYMAEV